MEILELFQPHPRCLVKSALSQTNISQKWQNINSVHKQMEKLGIMLETSNIKAAQLMLFKLPPVSASAAGAKKSC